MKRVFLILSLLGCLLASPFVRADEGMWLYNAFPKDKVKAKYSFAPDQQWLDHVRLSSVRFNNGGSGSFVSADGLAFTNHHVGANCIQQLSTGGHDYMKTGFYAKTQGDEAKCPDLELNVLVGMEDVTSQVKNVVQPGMSAAQAFQAQRAAMSSIEQDCTKSTGLRCDVVTFYSGEVYNLYKYKKYTDVRLVFAPEFDAAFFGGDPDNFTYPRYDLDISFFRVYENDKPVHLDHYLHWSPTGVKENDLIFVSGHPGSTGRLLTMSQIEFLRDVDYPTRMEIYRRMDAVLKNFSSQSEENARIAKEDIFGIENNIKRFIGYQEGLDDKQTMDGKAADEQKLQTSYKANPRNAGAPDPWQEIANAIQVERTIYKPLTFAERMRGFSSDLAQIARTLVRVTEEKTKPNGERLREYRDSSLPSLEQRLFSTAPIYKSLETVELATSLAQMQEALGPDNAVVKKTLNGKTSDEVAKQLIANTKLEDVAVRKQLYDGGVPAIQSSTDPLIALMRSIDPDARAVRKQYDDEVDAVERRDGAMIARARFDKTGFTEPPDATFTLRLSYGAVKGYTENGKHIPYFTTMGGAFRHAADHGNKDPYRLPDSWMNSKSKLRLSTPLNFVSTADIIGGNSGSPTINKGGEVVGIIFDGNLQTLPWNFAYSDKQARAVQVDSRGIQEALRNIYHATALADELMGKAPAEEKQAASPR
ncbi:MAG TPA: S46 family peptidase [Terriglobales bacterium]|nr:S46 family peptidase [Terriglobales bacterium]